MIIKNRKNYPKIINRFNISHDKIIDMLNDKDVMFQDGKVSSNQSITVSVVYPNGSKYYLDVISPNESLSIQFNDIALRTNEESYRLIRILNRKIGSSVGGHSIDYLSYNTMSIGNFKVSFNSNEKFTYNVVAEGGTQFVGAETLEQYTPASEGVTVNGQVVDSLQSNTEMIGGVALGGRSQIDIIATGGISVGGFLVPSLVNERIVSGGVLLNGVNQEIYEQNEFASDGSAISGSAEDNIIINFIPQSGVAISGSLLDNVTSVGGGGTSGTAIVYAVYDESPNNSILGNVLQIQDSLIDQSPYSQNVVVYGNAATTNSVYKYGSSSLAVPSTNDYFTIEQNNSLNFGTQDFTVEFWMYITGGSSTNRLNIFDFRGRNGTNTSALLIYRAVSSWYGYPVVRVWNGTNGDLISGTFNVGNNVWHHIAVSRESGTLRLFINGTQDQMGVSQAGAPTYSLTPPVVDNVSYFVDANGIALGGSDSNNSMTGYIDDIRIINGESYRNSNFTVPSSALSQPPPKSGGGSSIGGQSITIYEKPIIIDGGAISGGVAEDNAEYSVASSGGVEVAPKSNNIEELGYLVSAGFSGLEGKYCFSGYSQPAGTINSSIYQPYFTNATTGATISFYYFNSPYNSYGWRMGGLTYSNYSYLVLVNHPGGNTVYPPLTGWSVYAAGTPYPTPTLTETLCGDTYLVSIAETKVGGDSSVSRVSYFVSSGGVNVAGNSEEIYQDNMPVSGGLTIGGQSLDNIVDNFVSSGGVSVYAYTTELSDIIASGGSEVSGSSLYQISLIVPLIYGGSNIGGNADVVYEQNYVALGGSEISGTAEDNAEYSVVSSGGSALAGESLIVQLTAGQLYFDGMEQDLEVANGQLYFDGMEQDLEVANGQLYFDGMEQDLEVANGQLYFDGTTQDLGKAQGGIIIGG